MCKINIRVDDELKEQVEAICKSLGINLSTAVNMYFKKIVAENGIPFELKIISNQETLDAIEEGRRIAYDKTVKGYDSIEDLRKVLNV